MESQKNEDSNKTKESMALSPSRPCKSLYKQKLPMCHHIVFFIAFQVMLQKKIKRISQSGMTQNKHITISMPASNMCI